MSLQQLHMLWQYEFLLCSTLTDLPVRTCSARPNDSLNDLFPPMKDEDFRLLRQDILKMWVRATYFLQFQNVAGKGWGVFCPSDGDENYPTHRLLSPSKPTILGWIAKAPMEGQCPTAHRYLRSPLGDGFYLGGPISLVNQDSVGNVSVQCPASTNLLKRHLIIVYSLRKLISGSELFWTYITKGTCRRNLRLAPVSDWFLPECCSELQDAALPVAEVPQSRAASTTTSEPPAKKRSVGGIRPLTNSRELPRFCLCTYCGMNIDEHASYSPNLKRHLSLHHAVHIVRDIGKDPLDQDDPVTSREFTLFVDKLDNVLDSLHKRFINCQPACSFLQNSKDKELELKDGCDIDTEKERVFQLFLKESSVAFMKYQVLFLKGCTLPTRYDDLLPCKKSTNYDQVVWCDKKPSNNYFSINQLNLNKEEKQVQKAQVMCALKDIIIYGTELN